VWGRLTASPLSEAGQGPAFAAIERAVACVRAELPEFAVAYTGVNRFAAASRARIEREVAWLNALSLAAVLAVAFTFIRSVHRGLHLIPVVLLSMLGAWTCATLAFNRLHIMVFAVGSLLTGVAIDYGFYLFMQPPAQPEEDYWEKVRRLAKPLLASCLTTVAGFSLLLFSDLPSFANWVFLWAPAWSAPWRRPSSTSPPSGIRSSRPACFAVERGCRRGGAAAAAGCSSRRGSSRCRDWRC